MFVFYEKITNFAYRMLKCWSISNNFLFINQIKNKKQ